MTTLKNFKLVIGSLIMLILTVQIAQAQTYNLNNAASTLKVEGTSNIHDWDVIAEDQQGKLIVEFGNGQLVKIDQLEFIVKAESLKSGRSGMDKNTYKALNTEKYKQIIYKLDKVNAINCETNNSCKLTTTGSLTIAGSTKQIDIIFDVKIIDSQIIFSGNKTIKMTDFGIDPPKAVFGTITTGDAVEVKFKSSFTKK